MFKLIRPILMILPILLSFVAFSSNEQETKANTNRITETNLLTNRIVKISDNNLLNGQSKDDSKPVNVGFGLEFHNSFGVEINGCYYQVDQTFNGATGELKCGTLIVFCENSVEIYTGGSNCS